MQSRGSATKRPRTLPERRAILALDLDCFYASVAIRARPHLADKPVVIVQKHLCVTSNYVARSRAKGAVQKMTPVSKALAACPELVLIDGSDLTPFREASSEVRAIIRSWLHKRIDNLAGKLHGPSFNCPCQGLGLDEVFIDISRLVSEEINARAMPWKFHGHVFGETRDDTSRRTLMVASQLAHDLRAHVTRETTLTLCAGVGDSKLTAKLAVNMNKPDDQTIFLPDRAPEYVSQLHPRSLPGFGHGSLDKIQQWAKVNGLDREIETVADVLRTLGEGEKGIKVLTSILHSATTARHLIALCTAKDSSCVVDSGDAPKSMSAEDSCRSCTTMSDLESRITKQTTRLVNRLRCDGQLYSRYPKTLTVSYRFRGQGFVGTMRSVPMPMEVISVCCSIHPEAETKAIAAVRKASLAVLRDHANIKGSSSFDLTLFAVGATNFTDKNKNQRPRSTTRSISEFFMKETAQKSSRIKKSEEHTNAKKVRGARKVHPDEKRGLVMFDPGKPRDANENLILRCPICDVVLPSKNSEQNSHIDQCLGLDRTTPIPKKRRTKAQTFAVDSFFRRS